MMTNESGTYHYIVVGAGSARAIVAARMGSDEGAVVDPELRVRGVGKFRVIDTSVMPTIASGNINAAVLMLGEKGADLVRSG